MTPKLSLFTPTHNAKHLREVYDGIKAQAYENWEWVIVTNGPDSSMVDLQALIAAIGISDKRVRVHHSAIGSDKIGALKREAVELCHGDAFIEMDHDDLLVPGTLAKVAKGIAEGAGFVYSDVAVFNDGKLDSWGYAPSWGWEHYPLRVYDKPFLVTRNFDISPRSLCEVYFAPDHVRVWSRKAYWAAGGHDASMSVGDDHDLICRTYLTGVPFHHIGGCGYLYRYHASNTVKARNDAIQAQQRANRHKYLAPLIGEWCRREEHLTLDLLSQMREKSWHPDHPTQLRRPELSNQRLKLGESVYLKNRFGYITASDCLQLIRPEHLVEVMNALYEALLPGGYLTVIVPALTGRYADQNPLHRTRFNLNTFLHFSRKEFAAQLPGVACKFDLIQSEEFYPDDFHKQHDMKMLRVDLCALKGQRHPGPKLI